MKTIVTHPGQSHDVETNFSLLPLLDACQKEANGKKDGDSVQEKYLGNHSLSTLDHLPDENEKVLEIKRLVQDVLNSRQKIATGSDFVLFEPFANLLLNTSVAAFQNLDDKEQTAFNGAMHEAYFATAYQIVMEQVYGMAVHFVKPFVFRSTTAGSSLASYTEVVIDHSFITATFSQEPVLLRKEIRRKLALTGSIDHVKNLLPSLHQFKFSGLMLVSTRNVTHREVTKRCRELLVTNENFPGKDSIRALNAEIKAITGLQDIDLGLLLNREFCAPENNADEFLPACISASLANMLNSEASARLLERFFENRTQLLISSVSAMHKMASPIFTQLAVCGVESLLLYPVKCNQRLIGVFGITSSIAKHITEEHTHILEPLIDMLTIAMERSVERRDAKIDKIIKEQFTAVQSSVDWKFKEVALNHLNSGDINADSKIERVVFENVYPLYGSIDIRNSSIERMQAIQKDILKQLGMAVKIISRAGELCFLPLLGEMKYRLEKFIETPTIMLFPGDEVTIQQFLQENVSRILHHIAATVPEMKIDIENYFLLMNADTARHTVNYGKFEESINTVNSELSRFIDEEQSKIQQVYPHYFERFVTDGIDFNIYMGQSIAPSRPFEQFHLQNLKLWQLTTLVSAARLTYQLSKNLPVPLQTTQLILAHSKPINISFRSAERKFDVDGAYNIHYEIIKKRIDKVRIRSTNERLTQPGTIAIVYSQASEANEYAGYLEYLEKTGLVFGEVERLELEELRGVIGLKALRVRIVMETTSEMIAEALKGETIGYNSDSDSHSY